jgi:methanogenic corrinoid protein MtbC1
MANQDASVPKFPMRVVVRRTGLNPSLLRAWERRYAAVGPGRSDGGQRLYSEADVHRLALLRALVDAGHNIGQVAALPEEELRVLLSPEQVVVSSTGRGAASNGVSARAAADVSREGSVPGSAGAAGSSDLSSVADATRAGWGSHSHRAWTVASDGGTAESAAFLEDALRAVYAMDPRALDAVLNRSALALGPVVLVDGVLVPLLTRIGALWKQGDMQPALEHVASGILRRFLYGLIDRLAPPPGAPVMVVGTPAGHRHEFGAQLAAVVATAAGWDVLLLGADLPACEIAEAARRKRAPVVALSALHPVVDPALEGEMRELRDALSDEVTVLLGGPAALSHATELRGVGVEVLANLGELRVRAGELRRLL